MINYYTIFDLENRKIGFIGSVHVEYISYWYEILMIIAVILITASVILLGMQWYKDRQIKHLVI